MSTTLETTLYQEHLLVAGLPLADYLEIRAMWQDDEGFDEQAFIISLSGLVRLCDRA